MDGASNPASIATSISIGTAVLAGVLGSWVAMGSRKAADANRDPVVSILFGIAVLLILLNVIATGLIAGWGMAYVGLLKAALLLTALFAALGAVFGLMRGLRSGKAGKTQSA